MSMSLTEEKERLYEIAKMERQGYVFPTISEEEKSYYISYKKSRHSEDILEEFDSEELYHIREKIQQLWGKDELMNKYCPLLLAASCKTREIQESSLEMLDLFNYMM